MTKKVQWKDAWTKEEDENGDVIGEWARKRDDCKVYCTWCSKTFRAHSGITNLKSHSRSEGHLKISRSRRNSQNISKLITSTVTEESGDCDKQNALEDVAKTSEIRCVTRIVLKNQSFKSEDDLVEDLKAFCPDSKIPDKMKLHADKAAYLAQEALFPFVQETVLADVRSSDFYSLHVDEANNKSQNYLGI